MPKSSDIRPMHSGKRMFAELAGTLLNAAVVSLLVLGVGGLAYKLLKPDGWVGAWLGRFWQVHPGYAVLAFVGMLAGGYGLKRWLDSNAADGTRGDVLVYTGLALGLFFAFELAVTGRI
jgi:hypothetical protein